MSSQTRLELSADRAMLTQLHDSIPKVSILDVSTTIVQDVDDDRRGR